MTWTHTSRGRALDLADPHPDDFEYSEIAQSLAQQCRYNGCVRHFYSVAEHSVLMARAMRRIYPDRIDLQLACLLHDAAEAYTGDITWPVQQVLFDGPGGDEVQARYKTMQRKLDELICAPVGLDPDLLHSDIVREYDMRILLDEREVLLHGRPRPWAVDGQVPLGVIIRTWTPDQAEHWWRMAFEDLRNGHPVRGEP